MDGHDILKLGFEEGPQIGYALQVHRSVENLNEKRQLSRNAETLLLNIQRDPSTYLSYDGEVKGVQDLARELSRIQRIKELRQSQAPLDKPQSYSVFGRELIDPNTFGEMDMAMRIPVATKGALMPDAHPTGFQSLPVGGVLATENAVIPAAVGVDIGCRMHLSVLPVAPEVATVDLLSHLLNTHTRFGQGARFEKSERSEHPIMDDSRWDEMEITRGVKDRGYAQLGSSGGGNHFVEFGWFTPLEGIEAYFGLLKKGATYLAILSHSGSRGVGFKIAQHFTRLAWEENYGLPKEMRNFSWLDLDSDLGEQYWLAMSLAGDYAKACHECIHKKLSMGSKPLLSCDHHHNFAWRETHDGQEVIVHRKGATPAADGEMGIIPGSMATPSYLVRGKGHAAALHSSSHGAGRVGSRTEAIETISKKAMRDRLEAADVQLIGGALDEAPQAYKNIEDVMRLQKDLVTPIGKFLPFVVRMAS